MKDRILKFLESEHISPAEFADKIGVQRSSMSHILNGRNYPSAAFIQKMLQAYPTVNSRWLLIGDGKMNIYADDMNRPSPESKEGNGSSSAANSGLKLLTAREASSSNNPDSVKVPDNLINIQFEQAVHNKEESIKAPANEAEQNTLNNFGKEISGENQPLNIADSGIHTPDEKEIEQILFFYSDKTFRIYRPS